MTKVYTFVFGFILLLAAVPAAAQQSSPGPLRFRVTLSKEVASKAAAGRLFVLMTDARQDQQVLTVGFVPGSTWLAAREVESLAPDETIELNPDTIVYPKPFSQAKVG